jgi:DNA mismatch repair protein MutS2
VIFPKNFEQKIDFIKIRKQLADFCYSNMGKELVTDMSFDTNFINIKQRLLETKEFKAILDKEEEFPSDYYHDLRQSLKKIHIDGAFLEIKEILQLRQSLKTVKAIIRFFEKKESEIEYPNLKQIVDRIKIHSYIIDSINTILNNQGEIKNSASPELASIRYELASKQTAVTKLTHKIMTQARRDGWIDADTSLSVRDGRVVIPVQASFKRKIQGIIHDESATGKTCYVEPTPVVEMNNAISELEADERREIVKILKNFTVSIKPYIYDLEENIYFLGVIDFIRAKAIFSQKIDAEMPVVEEQPQISLKKARHPLLYLSFMKDNRAVVPLDMELNNRDRILLISGPNAGGKSVCLKTIGLLQYMLQCGMLISVDAKSKVGIFKKIFIDIGDEQSIDNDLSTYSSHLLNMKFFTKNANDKTLVLIDEFGTGTEPMIGGAIAEAVLNRLNKIETYGVITTHYTNLKHFASSEKGIVNGAMLYDTQKLEPRFVLEIGKPGSSFAFEIAYKIGLNKEIIDDAKSKIGEDNVNFDKHLREILRDKRYWEHKRQNIKKIERQLEALLAKEKEELENARVIRKEIKKKTEIEVKEVLTNTNKIIENTVRKIKEAQAEKSKTKEVRKQLDKFKEEVLNNNQEEEDRILRKIKKIKEKEQKIRDRNTDNEKNTTLKKEKQPKKIAFSIGMPVKMAGQTSIGEIVELSNKNAVVAFGNILTTVPVSRLEHISKQEKRSLLKTTTINYTRTYELNKRKMQFKSGLDVRGKRVDEAMQLVVEFIDEAIMVESNEVKILHGKGNGILRQVIREYLKTVDIVKSIKDEHIEFGGAGITVVEIG